MNIKAKLHIHRWKPVHAVSDLELGVFTVTSWCRCNEIEVKLLSAPLAPAPTAEAATESE